MAECVYTEQEASHMAADVHSLVNIKATKNDQHKTNHVWFDMRKPVATFTGRMEILKTLYHTLHHATGSAVISQGTSVNILGGIGKSELSRKYAFEYQDAYDGNLIWINSETYESLKDSFDRLAEQLNIPVKDKTIASIIQNIYKDLGKEKCLFIFDNAEEYKIIKEFLPLCLHSDIQAPHILITSRNKKWQLVDTGAMNVINLEHFTSDEALNFIKNALDIKNNSRDDEIKTLAKELDYFPLALGQAVAYIKMTNESPKKFRGETFGVSDYLRAYKDELLKAKLLGHRHENSQYKNSAVTTWNVTMKNIKEENKDSIKIIEIMAYLVPDSINPDLIFSELIEDEEKREDAIDLLLKYSMINIKDHVLSIHRLVQEVIRLQIKGKGTEKLVLEIALEILGFNLDDVDKINLISVWSYACDYGEIIDEFFFEYYVDDNITTPFHLFLISANIDAVEKILNHFKKKSNEKFQEILNSTKYYNRTPLEISIRQNNLEMAKLLIGFGAEKDHEFCVKVIFYGHVDLVKYFYPNNDECLLHAKFYSAFRSENVENVNNLLKDLKNEQIKNIMEVKITNLDPELIINERPVLYWAAVMGNLDIMKLLVINYGADINFNCGYGALLHNCVRMNHYEIFKFLIEIGVNCNTFDDYCNTVLHLAAERGQLEFVKYLIENYKCDINATDDYGQTLLHLAAERGQLEFVKYLIETNKFDINATNKYGQTVLHLAAQRGLLDILKYLINNNKCDINVTNDCVQAAALLGHLEIVKYLIENNKCDINATNYYMQRVLHLAAERGELEFVKYLIENNKCDINATNNYGQTLLHLAGERGQLEFVKYLIENNNCDINATDGYGQTVLHDAARRGQLELVKYLIENNKCDINATNNYGQTLLHLAGERGQLEFVKYLIENNKCDINATDGMGKTALDLATKCKSLEVVEYLTNRIN